MKHCWHVRCARYTLPPSLASTKARAAASLKQCSNRRFSRSSGPQAMRTQHPATHGIQLMWH
jgi:hypothetical protein